MAHSEDRSEHTDDLLRKLGALEHGSFKDEAERARVKDALAAALSRVENPWESVMRHIFAQPALAASLKVCYDVNLFRKWNELHDGQQLTSAQLSRLVDIDQELLARFLRHLAATNVIQQATPGTYAQTPFSRALGRELASTVPFLYNTTLPGFTNLPLYLQSKGYANPHDAGDTNWHHMRGISRFDELKQRPADMSIFQDVMAARSSATMCWTELFPPTNLITAGKDGVALVVDVGGGAGHDIERFRKVLPQNYKGELVLQDQGSAVNSAKIGDGVRAMEHDFFEAQPCKGATAYYLHTVLHDWPDERAVAILSNLAAACEPGYSRVLIHETVVTDSPSVQATTFDLQMMMVLSSFERTEAAWRAIVVAAGLQVVKIWRTTSSVESIIEAIKP